MSSSNLGIVKGFFAACTPLEALLKSTLDCLYDIHCLKLLPEYFPSMNQTYFNLSDYVLQFENTNRTVHNHLSNLFIEQWITKLNYSNYFNNCNPSICTYTTTDIIDYSYAVGLFISLYGGLIITLRLISPVLIKLVFKIKYQSRNRNLIQWLKQVNLFKNAQKRTEQDIKQQKITSYIYLILFLTSIIVLILYNLLNTEMVTEKIPNPISATYEKLEKQYSNALTCPCSMTTIPYQKFMSFDPIFHQICSSDFISNEWILMSKEILIPGINLDWRNRIYQQFNLLSKFCQLADETINKNKDEFLLKSFVISNMISQHDFNTQLNKTLNQFYRSTVVQFYQFIQVIGLSIQIDQPFMLPTVESEFRIDSFDIQLVNRNRTDMLKDVDVCFLFMIILNSTYQN